MMTTRKLAVVAMLIFGLAVGLVGSIFIGTSTLRETRTPTSTVTATSTTATSTVAITATVPAHRIGVRVVDGVGEFYDTETEEKIVPRGNNYIRLADQSACGAPGTIYHSTFNVGFYQPDRLEQALAKMREDGYNVVRAFINQLCVAYPSGRLSAEYMRNLADFLQRAKANNIFVMLAIDDPPFPGYAEKIPHYDDIDWGNRHFLTREGIEAESRFWGDFIMELTNLGAPLDYVFAYGLRNEAFLLNNAKPFTLESGLVTTANGKTYDMSKPEDRERMVDEGLVYWIDQVRAGILDVDPTALVTVGFFWPQQPNPARVGDPRVIRTYWAIADHEMGGSSADFIDLHLYPGLELTLSQYVENYEINGFTGKPILMGEFGAFKEAYWSASWVAQDLQDWQVASCSHGFDGWLLWTWDSSEQPELWNALDAEELINQALSPQNRPDPCISGPYPGQNIAFLRPSKASHFLTTNPPSMAFDGKPNSWWGAGAFPPQWIEVDLQTPSTIKKVRLLVSQSPAGETVHRVLGKGSAGEAYKVLHEFRGFTNDNDVLEYAPPTPWSSIRFIRIETLTSPSWVSWREIEVLRGPEQTSSALSSVQNTEGVPPASHPATLCVTERVTGSRRSLSPV